MENKKFQRKMENFICEHCGRKVIGNGYTNHCPYCLWSKHVDINPGDRAEICGGMMEPVRVYYQGGKHIIEQKCQICSKVRKIKADKKDNMDELIKKSIGA